MLCGILLMNKNQHRSDGMQVLRQLMPKPCFSKSYEFEFRSVLLIFICCWRRHSLRSVPHNMKTRRCCLLCSLRMDQTTTQNQTTLAE
jgi:hypothetical protein